MADSLTVEVEGKGEINHYVQVFDMSGWWCHLLTEDRERGRPRLGEEEFAFTHVAFNMNIRYPNGDTNQALVHTSLELRREARHGDENSGAISEQTSTAKSLIGIILGRECVLGILYGHLPGMESMIEPISKNI